MLLHRINSFVFTFIQWPGVMLIAATIGVMAVLVIMIKSCVAVSYFIVVATSLTRRRWPRPSTLRLNLFSNDGLCARALSLYAPMPAVSSGAAAES